MWKMEKLCQLTDLFISLGNREKLWLPAVSRIGLKGTTFFWCWLTRKRPWWPAQGLLVLCSPSTTSFHLWCTKTLLASKVFEFDCLIAKGSSTFLIHSLTTVVLRKPSKISCYHRSACPCWVFFVVFVF